MYHAIHFDDSETPSRNCDTYTTFGLISNGRPDVASPELKSAYVDIPGTNGSLDYTEALNGLTYQNRSGSWDFYVLNNYGNNEQGWVTKWHSIMNALHGQYFDRIWLEDEGIPVSGTNGERFTCNWFYKGRLTVNEWKSDPQFSKVVIDYVLEPYKRRLQTEENIKDWLWDDLFDGPTIDPYIQFGKFAVDGTKLRTIVCGGDLNTFSVFCTSTMSMKPAGSSEEPIVFPAGETTDAFTLTSGKHLLTFSGRGEITLSNDEGSLLSL